MMRFIYAVFFALAVSSLSSFQVQAQEAQPSLKEWTFLVFINGHNNLDSFGEMNIKQMEAVGSTDQINVVVQWASLKNKNTKRLLVQKSKDANKVTSPILENLPPVDMGSAEELYKFIEWGVKKYPAKKYFINVWNHGNGWHLNRNDFSQRDISYDDVFGTHITTEQLAEVLHRSAVLTGQAIELYGSDACLMSMVEIATEMKGSVKYSAGSTEVEPGEGWPYSTFLADWAKNPKMDGRALGSLLTEKYFEAYTGGIYGHQEVTFSALDLTRLAPVLESLNRLTSDLVQTPQKDMANLKKAAEASRAYYSSDYRELTDFLTHLSEAKLIKNPAEIATFNLAFKEFVILSRATDDYMASQGASVWLPTRGFQFEEYKDRYLNLSFHKATGWGELLKIIATP
jgi:uncharacterized protein YbaA (DUF1428 family)